MQENNRVLKTLKAFFMPYATEEYEESFENDEELYEHNIYVALTLAQGSSMFIAIVSDLLVLADIINKTPIDIWDMLANTICTLTAIVITVVKGKRFAKNDENYLDNDREKD